MPLSLTTHHHRPFNTTIRIKLPSILLEKKTLLSIQDILRPSNKMMKPPARVALLPLCVIRVRCAVVAVAATTLTPISVVNAECRLHLRIGSLPLITLHVSTLPRMRLQPLAPINRPLHPALLRSRHHPPTTRHQCP